MTEANDKKGGNILVLVCIIIGFIVIFLTSTTNTASLMPSGEAQARRFGEAMGETFAAIVISSVITFVIGRFSNSNRKYTFIITFGIIIFMIILGGIVGKK